jgi:hypothetical protein
MSHRSSEILMKLFRILDWAGRTVATESKVKFLLAAALQSPTMWRNGHNLHIFDEVPSEPANDVLTG